MYKNINIKKIILLLTAFIMFFSFNIEAKAAEKATCEYCVDKRGCIQMNQKKNGNFSYKYKKKRTNKKWKKVPSDIEIKDPKNFSKRCPRISFTEKKKVTFLETCNDLSLCPQAYTDTLLGIDDGKRLYEASNAKEYLKNKATKNNDEDINKDLIIPKKECTGEEDCQKKCEDILGEELVEKLQEIVNIIRIMVPILLIVFGTLDFGKAIFSGDENEMKKAQSRFIKRLIIAIGFFIIPSILQLLLNIGAKVWNIEDPSFCGIKFSFK